MEEILVFLNQIFPLSPACIDYLASVVQYRPVAKNEIILDFGEVNRNLYFIKSGLLRCYYMVYDKEVSDWFFGNNETIVSIGSFYEQLPSEDCIIVEEAGELYSITREQYFYAKRTFHEFAFIASELLEKYLVTFHTHARILRKYEAPERYRLLREKFPELMDRILDKYKASWLGMTPEMYSRVRGRRE
jgi:CRP-like cAMP-binding protein